MSSLTGPIGVFDSGLGGLTILKELATTMPWEDFVYLGDIARLPYGTKSQQVVAKYSNTCANFLCQQGIKALVVACNTATAMALPLLRQQLSIPVLGVIEPGVRACLDISEKNPILVLATEGTVKSEAYLKEFQRQGFHGKVDQLFCPLLVPLAEEGWFDHSITKDVIRNYLSSTDISQYGALLLGCTHYPLLEQSFRNVLGDAVPITHGGALLAKQLASFLGEKNLLQTQPRPRAMTFLSTDQIKASLPILNALFTENVFFKTIDL
ncbi:MAG: glutamate racemase [Proteobacteria bacterium]|nr:glutamate racemase [Pseudomonadota bacterium]NDC24711.1 glutamate racemase [Pseudomonadota bacterium]NDD05137.1 glutamate racemase [Pseudomonadota bacterium]NDG27434.1 glutamate racemase [Pseudomonadota bacterium]